MAACHCMLTRSCVVCVCVCAAEKLIHNETSEKGGLAQIAWLFINDRCDARSEQHMPLASQSQSHVTVC